MSPKLREENFVSVDVERIREQCKRRKVKITDLAENYIFTSYRNFNKQLAKGQIKKTWLDIICDKLNVTRKYFIGECQHPYSRVEDYYAVDKMKEGLSQFLKFSQNLHYIEKLEQLDASDFLNIETIIIAMLDSPTEVNTIIPYEDLEKIHEKEVRSWDLSLEK